MLPDPDLATFLGSNTATTNETTSSQSCVPDDLVPAEPPDLPAQLESLLHLVWQCEKEWRLDDRIDLAFRREEAAARKRR